MRARSWLVLTGLVLISAACGGRLVERGGDGGDGATSPGGTTSTGTGARPSGNGATTSAGGTSTGTAGTAIGFGGKTSGVSGATSMGGGALCPDIPCKFQACGPNQARVPTPDGCCFYCENVCPPCPGIACASGSHLEMIPGACCPTCVQDSCEDQLRGYLELREQLYEKYSSLGCMVNQDCTTYYEKNNCSVGCGVAVSVQAVNYLDSNLQSYAQQTCSPSCMLGTPGCGPTALPVCIKGRCQ